MVRSRLAIVAGLLTLAACGSTDDNPSAGAVPASTDDPAAPAATPAPTDPTTDATAVSTTAPAGGDSTPTASTGTTPAGTAPAGTAAPAPAATTTAAPVVAPLPDDGCSADNSPTATDVADGPVPSLELRAESVSNELPDLAVRRINCAGGWVNLKNEIPAATPLLIWFWAPH